MAKLWVVSVLMMWGLALAAVDKPVVKPALTVTTAAVDKASWANTIDTQGFIVPWQEAVVSARVTGLPIVEIRVGVGDLVKKGDILAVFDDRTVRAELAQAEATLAQSLANRKQAEANFNRIHKLEKQNLVSDQDALNASTQTKTTAAQQAVAKAAITALKIRLEHTQVVAPDDGIITAQTVLLGQVPQIGAELFRLIRQQRLEWRAELTAQQLNQLKIGMPAQINLPDHSIAYGKIRQFSPALDNTSRLGIAFVELQAGSTAKAGMFVSGRLEIAHTDALIVPAESVVVRDGRSSLFLLKENNRVQQLAVNTGRRQGKFIEILQGVNLGDQVIVRGAGFLNDGDLIQVLPPS